MKTIKANCNNCGHSRTKHKHHHQMICAECGCREFKCSWCGSVNATGRTSGGSYRTNDQVDVGLDALGLTTKIAASRKYSEYLMYWYWQQMPCGCWVEFDVRKAFS